MKKTYFPKWHACLEVSAIIIAFLGGFSGIKIQESMTGLSVIFTLVSGILYLIWFKDHFDNLSSLGEKPTKSSKVAIIELCIPGIFLWYRYSNLSQLLKLSKTKIKNTLVIFWVILLTISDVCTNILGKLEQTFIFIGLIAFIVALCLKYYIINNIVEAQNNRFESLESNNDKKINKNSDIENLEVEELEKVLKQKKLEIEKQDKRQKLLDELEKLEQS